MKETGPSPEILDFCLFDCIAGNESRQMVSTSQKEGNSEKGLGEEEKITFIQTCYILW